MEKGIRRKLKDGKKFSCEATADFGRVEVYDEELKKFVKKQDKRRKTIHTAQIEEEMMTELEKATKQAQKQQRLEKAKAERLKGNPSEDILIEYK